MSINEPSASLRRTGKSVDTVLPFPVRQRLWDQLWQRLLSAPVEEGDRSVPPRDRQQEGR
jgi:hypothetical protein